MSELRTLRSDARSIWQAGVDAVKPAALLPAALKDPKLRTLLEAAPRLLVLGTGKAGGAMSVALENAVPHLLDRIEGQVNIPAGSELPTKKIHLCRARPAGSNHPTQEGVAGTERILELARSAGPNDVALCLLSGGGSALLPCPAPGITLEDKQRVTKSLHACGATIQQMNALRKHLSAVKGGRLAQAFRGQALFSLIISDVRGDPLDVIASGPTAADPSTFADALAVLEKFNLRSQTPQAVLDHLERGAAGLIPETCKSLPAHIHNQVIGNIDTAYRAAWTAAEALGYAVVPLGTDLHGEAQTAGETILRKAQEVRASQEAKRSPACLLAGGETTVTLSSQPGQGGRNQELVLAALVRLMKDETDLENLVFLSGGTDGEDGPTDAAGAWIDASTRRNAHRLGLDPGRFLHQHDAYHFFQATGDLLVTGPTQTNVMDLAVVLIAR